jgi:FlaA1/EpsC-like NDP-sugar epimerase
MKDMQNFYEDKTTLETGGIGSIGSEVLKKLLELNPSVVRVLDNNETGLFDLEHELQSKKIRSFVGDVRDKDRLKRAIENVDLVFHIAALKHVPLCEYNPFEAVKTNVLGTQNLIEVSMDEKVEKFITISTDKAVNPINVMGATKLLAEKLTISANFYKGLRETSYSCIRFGNVLHSRGSVLPLFKEQIRKGGPITLTDPNMTRFIMKISQAVELILKATKIAEGGEIFILKMPAVKMKDLADAMIEKFSPEYGHRPKQIKIEIIKKRSGEKTFEELMSEDEAENAYENEEMFVISPNKPKGTFKKVDRINKFSSNYTHLLSMEELRELL